MNIYIDGIIYSLQKNRGITCYINELLKGLVKKNHIHIFLHTFLREEDLNFLKNVDVVNIKSIFNTRNKIIKYITYPFDIFFSELFFKKNRLNEGIFHSSYFTTYKNLHIPQIITVYDMIHEKFPQFFSGIFDQLFLKKKRKAINVADGIICISKQTAEDLIAFYKIDPVKVFITYLGVDKFFSIRSEEEKNDFIVRMNVSAPYILFAGKRSLYKNFNLFISAFSKWKNGENFSLILVGGGKITRNEKKIFEKLHIANRIINYDFVSSSDLVLFYNCADAFVFPSLYEGFGLPLLEAMACGTKVLASDIPVFKEIGEDIPVFFNPTEEESIIKSLDSIFTWDFTKKERGLILAKKFDWDIMTKQTIEVYKKYLHYEN